MKDIEALDAVILQFSTTYKIESIVAKGYRLPDDGSKRGEGGKRVPIVNNVEAMRRALEGADIELIDENGRTGIATKDDAQPKAV